MTQAAKKILIIEDNVMNMKLFHDLLDAHGYEIFEAEDGIHAISLARKIIPDLIIIDIQLPEISGIDVAKQIKLEDNLKDIPIIAVTAFSIKENEDQAIEAGCDAYISKPITIDNFLEVIGKFV